MPRGSHSIYQRPAVSVVSWWCIRPPLHPTRFIAYARIQTDARCQTNVVNISRYRNGTGYVVTAWVPDELIQDAAEVGADHGFSLVGEACTVGERTPPTGDERTPAKFEQVEAQP